MPYFSEEEIGKVRRAADIVQIIGDALPLKKAGRHFKGLCPFHPEKTPSFMVNPERQIYHCFGCGEGGNAISFVMKQEGLEFPQALEKLARRFGITLQQSREEDPARQRKKTEKELLIKINRIAARYFFDNLHGEKGAKGRAYLEGRKIKMEIAREALLGYASPSGRDLVNHLQEKGVSLELAEKIGLVRSRDGNRFDFFRNRLIFTIVSSQGEILGFSGRSLDPENEPKYLNSPDSVVYNKSESLLGFNLAKQAIRIKDQAILVEGNFDQLRLFQEGLQNTVAPLGTALTEKQLSLLRRFTSNFVLIFDGDAAGQKAALRSLEVCLPLGIMPKVVTLESTEDPDSFVMKGGAKPLLERTRSAPYLLDVTLERMMEKGGDSAPGMRTVVEEMSHFLSLLPGDVEKSLYIQKVAHLTGLPDKIVARETLKKGKKGSNFPPELHEDTRRVPVVEKTLIEILISGRVPPADLFGEIKGSDFGDPVLGEIWNLLGADFADHREIDVGRIVTGELPDGLKGRLTQLAVGAAEWGDREEVFAQDCVKKFRMGRFRGILKGISREIREAERAQDLKKVQELLRKQSVILKDVNTLH
ncbi:MAG: DNA primase [Deltaproteobacteria bacterium]|nr:DNA primase [Deltaproteobacteria bacterium]MBI4374333.1 DNA primase [Deltaproteobacteria bacterium]